ncbi:cysteine rich repeat-containing protein [Rhodoferax sp.]|uniref:cysteine rich repeat-containing protein n=1 Tax=Rhodoferax sp. TaxID=50421 RepID=UPI00284AF4F8|nr:cysteine rich repeat-containing protein [Rhodoferax sp.]MDR3371257.1 cysteine rich repeat-containing protein [Rhodoferax sp.]
MKPHPLARVTAIGLTLAFAFSSPVWAARNAAMQACRADFSKLCSGVKLGGGRAAECLKQHDAESIFQSRYEPEGGGS